VERRVATKAVNSLVSRPGGGQAVRPQKGTERRTPQNRKKINKNGRQQKSLNTDSVSTVGEPRIPKYLVRGRRHRPDPPLGCFSVPIAVASPADFVRLHYDQTFARQRQAGNPATVFSRKGMFHGRGPASRVRGPPTMSGSAKREPPPGAFATQRIFIGPGDVVTCTGQKTKITKLKGREGRTARSRSKGGPGS